MRALGILMLALAALAIAAAPASAKVKPSVSISLPAQGDQGVPVPYSWSAARIPKRAKLVVQRQMGTARRFRTIAKPPTSKGSGNLPALRLGRYTVRIALLGKQGKVLVAKTARLAVFGNLPFSVLFDPTTPGTQTTTTRTFSYVISSGLTPAMSISRASNHCRSIHFDWLSGPGSGVSTTQGSGTMTLVQESLDPVSATSPWHSVSVLDARLKPGESWSINTSFTGPENDSTFYFNGHASCDSAQAVRYY